MFHLREKLLLCVIVACVPLLLYGSRREEGFSITEGSDVQLSDRAFPCKTEQQLSEALDHFVRGEIDAQKEMIESGRCFSAMNNDQTWTAVKFSGRFWSIKNQQHEQPYWVLREWLTVD